jgi:hypothetical protein
MMQIAGLSRSHSQRAADLESVREVARQHYVDFLRDAVLAKCGISAMRIAGNSLRHRSEGGAKSGPRQAQAQGSDGESEIDRSAAVTALQSEQKLVVNLGEREDNVVFSPSPRIFVPKALRRFHLHVRTSRYRGLNCVDQRLKYRTFVRHLNDSRMEFRKRTLASGHATPSTLRAIVR